MVFCRVSSRADHFSGNTTPFEAFQIWIDQGGCPLRRLPLTFFFFSLVERSQEWIVSIYREVSVVQLN